MTQRGYDLRFDLDDAPTRWYWLVFHPQRETTAEYRLQDQGYDTYLPRAVDQHGKLEPFLPFYLALGARFPAWPSILRTPGIEGVLTGASPAPVGLPEQHIAELRKREDGQPVKIGERWVRPIKVGHDAAFSACRLEPGDPIEVTDGRYFAHSGIFDRQDGRERVFIFVEMFQRMTRASVRREHVAKRDQKAAAGRQGGEARARNLSPEQRSESCRKAARARWAK